MVGIVASVHTAIQLESPLDAGVVIHYEIGVLPVAFQFQAGSMVDDESSIPWPVVHVEMDLFAVSGKIQVLSHSSTHVHSKLFAARRAEVSIAAQIRLHVHPTPARTCFNADVHTLVPSLRMPFPHSLPLSKTPNVPTL